MTQHEYIFIAVSIILGLAITRLLSSIAGLVRAHKRVSFHWATALWGACIMLFILLLGGWAGNSAVSPPGYDWPEPGRFQIEIARIGGLRW